MLKGCSRRYFVKKPLTMYRYHKYQFTKSFFSREKAILITKIRESILKEINRHEIFRKDQATILSWVACSYCHCGEIEKGRKAFLKSLHINFNWFSLFFLLVSFIEGGKYYKKAEILLNAVCQNSVWRIRKLLARWKYKSSYKIALNIINNF